MYFLLLDMKMNKKRDDRFLLNKKAQVLIGKHKNAQITIFVIVAIIIVLVIALIFFFKESFGKSLTQEEIVFEQQVQEINSFVKSCVENSGYNVLYGVGQYGGYFFPSEFSTDSGVSYYIIDNKTDAPSKKRIEEEISYYVNEEIFLCVENFMDFPDINVRHGDRSVTTRIEDEEIILNVNYPLYITSSNLTSGLEDFEDIKIPIRLGIIYDVVLEIIQEQLEADNVCLSCLVNLGIENDLYVDMIDYDEDVIIFTIRDENSNIDNGFYEFKFAVKNDGI